MHVNYFVKTYKSQFVNFIEFRKENLFFCFMCTYEERLKGSSSCCLCCFCRACQARCFLDRYRKRERGQHLGIAIPGQQCKKGHFPVSIVAIWGASFCRTGGWGCIDDFRMVLAG